MPRKKKAKPAVAEVVDPTALVECPECGTRGFIDGSGEICPLCKGEGEVTQATIDESKLTPWPHTFPPMRKWLPWATPEAQAEQAREDARLAKHPLPPELAAAYYGKPQADDAVEEKEATDVPPPA